MSNVQLSNCPVLVVSYKHLVITRKIGSKHIDFDDLICRCDEIFVPLHCQRKKAKFAA